MDALIRRWLGCFKGEDWLIQRVIMLTGYQRVGFEYGLHQAVIICKPGEPGSVRLILLKSQPSGQADILRSWDCHCQILPVLRRGEYQRYWDWPKPQHKPRWSLRSGKVCSIVSMWQTDFPAEGREAIQELPKNSVIEQANDYWTQPSASSKSRQETSFRIC